MPLIYERAAQPATPMWCVQGSTFGFSMIFWANLSKTARKNMSGGAIRLAIKRKPTDRMPIFDSQSVANTCYFSNAANGDAAVRIEASTTQNLPVGAFYYDIFVTLAGTTERVMYGTFVVNPRISQ
jgi:hypothetical protein